MGPHRVRLPSSLVVCSTGRVLQRGRHIADVLRNAHLHAEGNLTTNRQFAPVFLKIL